MPEAPPKDAKTAAEIRRERQAAALRENLRKRKEQARGKREAEGPPGARDQARDGTDAA